jgi:anti-sigma factor RsiW
MSHARAEELELYVLGALEAQESARLEGHVRSCHPCAAALAAEARVETALRELVPSVRRAPAKIVRLPDRRPVARRSGGWSGLMAAAAAIAVIWGMGTVRVGSKGGGRAGLAEGAPLVCEATPEEPLCRWPLASFADPTDAVCRAPAACPVLQSRMP